MKVLPLVLLLAGCAATPTAGRAAPGPYHGPEAAPTTTPATATPAAAATPTAGRATPGPYQDLEEARTCRLRAKEAADAGDGTTAQLHLLDAKAAADRLLAATPGDPEALREAGRIERDSFRFAEGAARFRAALEKSPARDGETVYDLAYCLAYGGDFAAALPLFEEAEVLLGPEIRIEINAAICEERVGRLAAGLGRLARLYGAELAAKRDGRAALEKTWDLTVQKREFEAGVAAFRALGEAHPDRPEPFFMLGNLLSFLARHADAADAYAKSAAAAPTPAALARRARELSLLGAARRTEADSAVRAALAGAAELPETAEAALRTVRLHLAAGEPGTARDLAVAAGKVIEGNVDLALAEGDAHLGEGRADLADRAYARARELDSFSTEAEARAARAALAAARGGRPAGEAFPDAPGGPLDPVPPKEVLLDFEEPDVLVRPLAGVKFADGAARFPSRVYLHFFPDLDARRWTRLEVRVRAEAGPAKLRVALADGYDQMSDAPPGYLHWSEAPAVGTAWTDLSIPFGAFAPDPAVRSAPTDLARVKCAILEFAAPDGKGAPAAWIDSIALRNEATGAVRILQAFDEPPAETGVIFDGTTASFTRAITTVDAAADLLPTGSGPVSPAIVEDQNGRFDPSMAGSGAGALRLRHGESRYFPSKQAKPAALQDGPGAGILRLNPDRDLQRFRFLTFLARGETGGEKLRLRFLDAHSLSLESILPAARWPRSVFPRTAKADGTIALGAGWRMYRVPLEAYPELDRGAMAEIRFEVGSEVGNAPGATIYLDAIGLEY
jgi:tetratricopeptide (TPR) repeat protein